MFIPLTGAVRRKLGKPASVGWQYHQGGNLSEGGQELSCRDFPTFCTGRWTCDDNGLRRSYSGNFLTFFLLVNAAEVHKHKECLSLIFFDNFVEDFVWRIGCRDLIVYSICLSFIQLIVVIFSSLNDFLQGWDFESINTAIGNDSNNRFEMEPINEMMVGHNVSLTFAVKSSLPDSFTWFAQVSLQTV